MEYDNKIIYINYLLYTTIKYKLQLSKEFEKNIDYN